MAEGSAFGCLAERIERPSPPFSVGETRAERRVRQEQNKERPLFVQIDARYEEVTGNRWPGYTGPSIVKTTTLFGPPNNGPLLRTASQLKAVIDMIVSVTPSEIPTLYIDLEGRDLSKNGTIAIMQLLIAPLNRIFMIDVHLMGTSVFDMAGSDGITTLKSILESHIITKVLFDCRNDSNALSFLFGVNLRSVIDLQVMKAAYQGRNPDQHYLCGLTKAIKDDVLYNASEADRAFPGLVKDAGNALFAPDRGGSYAAFESKPLPIELVRYCALDVMFMQALYERYDNWLESGSWHAIFRSGESVPQGKACIRKNVELATRLRVLRSQTMEYNWNNPCKIKDPWVFYHNCEERRVPSVEYCSEVIPYVQLKPEHSERRFEIAADEEWDVAMGDMEAHARKRVEELLEWVMERY